VVIESIPLEDELGDVLEKAMLHAGLTEQELASRAGVSPEKIRDAIDYRYDLSTPELRALARVLHLNEIGLIALSQGQYPLPAIAGLPFCLYPLRSTHGIGVANAYIVADCSQSSGLLFDAGPDYAALKRVWPRAIRKIEAVFITHAETEHVGGLCDLLAAFGPVPVVGPPGASLPSAGSMGVGEGARFTFGKFEVRALQTPGHAEAHNCYAVSVPRLPSAPGLLISGDLLFAGSVGGAHFCERRLKESLLRVTRELPPETVVAPGHGPLTTVRNEQQFNPFVA
jgi:hydroxyacylglutathione hydrolase